MNKNLPPWQAHGYFTSSYLLRSPGNYCANCGEKIIIDPHKISHNKFWNSNPHRLENIGYCHDYDWTKNPPDDFLV